MYFKYTPVASLPAALQLELFKLGEVKWIPNYPSKN
jgi:hypothetical protein